MELSLEKINNQIQNHPLNKEELKKQFIEKTELLGLKHTFDFDEAYEIGVQIRQRNKFREKINEFQNEVLSSVGKHIDEDGEVMELNPIKETFADGCYIREIYNPANEFIFTKIHAKEHPYFLLKGEMTILTHDGLEHIQAPHYGITKPGIKRLIYTHTECIFVTVHATNAETSEDVEKEIIAEDFNDPRVALEDIKLINKIKELL
tara:strand:+ start:3004 stop:3621 length:618 start_codon:yes stop_codon:yes gene_type:complete